MWPTIVKYAAMNKQKTLFILDDDQKYVRIVSAILESNGYRVFENSEGNIPELMRLCLPDLVLLDCNMGSKSGVEICKQFKMNPDTSHIPVILVSGESNICELAHQAQANDFLPKPFDLNHLLYKVQFNLAKEILPAHYS